MAFVLRSFHARTVFAIPPLRPDPHFHSLYVNARTGDLLEAIVQSFGRIVAYASLAVRERGEGDSAALEILFVLNPVVNKLEIGYSHCHWGTVG